MNEIDEVGRSNQPLVRIWLCGPFQLDWLDPVTGNASPYSAQDLQGRDSTQALSLLKLLLCQPERQAHRDWIMEQFWPEHSRSVATHRLENVFSRLRKLLIPPSGGESLLHSTRGKKNGGVLYSLSTYPQVWVDTDAVTWNVEQAARMERFGDDSLPFWQRAFDLLKRGPLLADEPYATWVKERRELLEGYTRQCVHALARLYLARFGEAGKAETIMLLRIYWQQHKTDEDALHPLMELLGEQERYQEAEGYYQQLLLALTDLGTTEEEKPREPDARTSDIRDYLSIKQIRRALKMEVSFPSVSPSNHTSGVQKQKLLVSFKEAEARRNDMLTTTPSSTTQQIPYVETVLSDLAARFVSGYDGPSSNRIVGIEQYWDHPENALPLLEEVHQLTLQNTRIMCWLAVVEAEVHAYLGDVESCDAALKTAKEISKDEPLGEDWYATGFSASRLAGYEGACFIRLHQPSRALLALQQALSLLDPQAIRRQSTLLTDMGIAYAQQGNIQKACQLASQALSLTKQTKSRSVLERIRLVRSELEACRETNEVQELEKHIDHTLTLITA